MGEGVKEKISELITNTNEESLDSVKNTILTSINLLIKESAILGISNDISDGYHTIGELYDHRITNFIALCKVTQRFIAHSLKQGFVDPGTVLPAWKSQLHSDGSSFDGWFVLGLFKEAGKQITYHLPMSRWDECEFALTLDQAPEWDGHTSADVLERLKQL